MWDRVLAWVLARVMAELSDRPARQLECHARFGHDGPGVIALGTQARYTNKKGELKNFRKVSGRANGQQISPLRPSRQRELRMSKRVVAAIAALSISGGAALAQEVKVGVVLPYTGIGAEFARQM